MAAFDFPSSPSPLQEYTPDGTDLTYVWNGYGWVVKSGGTNLDDYLPLIGGNMKGDITFGPGGDASKLQITNATGAITAPGTEPVRFVSAKSTDQYKFATPNGNFNASVSSENLTASRTFKFPDEGGTLAIAENIPQEVRFLGPIDVTGTAPTSPNTGDIYVNDTAGNAGASWTGLNEEFIALNQLVFYTALSDWVAGGVTDASQYVTIGTQQTVTGQKSFTQNVGIGGTLPASPNISLQADGSSSFGSTLTVRDTPVGGANTGIELNSNGGVSASRPSGAAAAVFTGYTTGTAAATSTINQDGSAEFAAGQAIIQQSGASEFVRAVADTTNIANQHWIRGGYKTPGGNNVYTANINCDGGASFVAGEITLNAVTGAGAALNVRRNDDGQAIGVYTDDFTSGSRIITLDSNGRILSGSDASASSKYGIVDVGYVAGRNAAGVAVFSGALVSGGETSKILAEGNAIFGGTDGDIDAENKDVCFLGNGAYASNRSNANDGAFSARKDGTLTYLVNADGTVQVGGSLSGNTPTPNITLNPNGSALFDASGGGATSNGITSIISNTQASTAAPFNAKNNTSDGYNFIGVNGGNSNQFTFCVLADGELQLGTNLDPIIGESGRTITLKGVDGSASFGNTVTAPSFYGNASGNAQIWYGGTGGTSIITADGNATFSQDVTSTSWPNSGYRLDGGGAIQLNQAGSQASVDIQQVGFTKIALNGDGSATFAGSVAINGQNGGLDGGKDGVFLSQEGRVYVSRSDANPVYEGYTTGNSTPTFQVLPNGSADFASDVTIGGDLSVDGEVGLASLTLSTELIVGVDPAGGAAIGASVDNGGSFTAAHTDGAQKLWIGYDVGNSTPTSFIQANGLGSFSAGDFVISANNGDLTVHPNAELIVGSSSAKFSEIIGSTAEGVGVYASVWFDSGGNITSGKTAINVSSVTRNGTGRYTVNFSPAIPTNDFTVTTCSGPGGDGAISGVGSTINTSQIQYWTSANNNGAQDYGNNIMMVFIHTD